MSDRPKYLRLDSISMRVIISVCQRTHVLNSKEAGKYAYNYSSAVWVFREAKNQPIIASTAGVHDADFSLNPTASNGRKS
jgi:hypothetical protein